MNIDITKTKNNSQQNSLENRLARLEKIIYQLFQAIDNTKQNNSSQGAIEPNLLAQITKVQAGGSQTPPAINRKANNNLNINDKNSLLMSQGQIISELAAAIMRANQRNS